MSDPQWLVVGAPVSLYWPGRLNPRVRLRTVERLTKTLVVLDDGTRVRRDGLTVPGGWLLPRDDPLVAAAIEAARRDRESRQVEELMRNWRATGDNDCARRAVRILDALGRTR